MIYVGVDIGGTFTDIVVFDEKEPEHIEIVKISTDSSEPEEAVVEGLRRYQGSAQRVSLLSHATTVDTNALGPSDQCHWSGEETGLLLEEG